MKKVKMDGYDPIVLTKATENVVIDGNKRKYARLARPLRFYGGTTSATEVGCNLRCKFCFSDAPVRKPLVTEKALMLHRYRLLAEPRVQYS